MPKVSKAQKTTTKPKQAAPLEEQRVEFFCCRCRRKHTKQRGNYPSSQSSIYHGNGGYLPICNNCLDELFEHYKESLGGEIEALKRICMKFDIYWNPEIYAMVYKIYKGNTSVSRVRAYISKSNLIKFVGKTFDDSLDEELITLGEQVINENSDFEILTDSRNGDGEATIVVPKEVINYWGAGFTPEMYFELEDRKSYWMSQFPTGTVLSPGEEGLLRQICNLEISINQDKMAGRPIDKSVNTLNTLFGSMNIKPSQAKENEENYIPFGVEIAKFEEEHPIIIPDDDFKDVDGLHKNVIAWFLGSLCKTAGIKNEYSTVFEEEVSRYTVERPVYAEEDGEEGDDTG